MFAFFELLFVFSFVLFLAGDVITQQFSHFLSVEARNDTFHSCQLTETRVDNFLCHVFLSKSYSELWEFCKQLLLVQQVDEELTKACRCLVCAGMLPDDA